MEDFAKVDEVAVNEDLNALEAKLEVELESDESPSKYLSKEEELALGRCIQEYLKAEKTLKSGRRITQAKREELEQKVKEGKLAAEKLVISNMGLVYDRANHFKRRYPSAPEFEDLVQEGMAGMMVALQKYDPNMGNKFSTVAYYWIMQSIGRGTNKTGRLVRLPENRISDFTKINRVMASKEAEGLTSKELDELILKRVEISKNDLMNIRAAAYTPASLNKVVSSENGSTKELIDFVGEKNVSQSSESVMIHQEMKHALLEAVASLDVMKREIVLSTFDIADTGMKADEIKAKYNIPAFKYKRIQNQALKELRGLLTDKGFSLEDFTSSL